MQHRQPGASGLKVPAPSFGTGTFAGRTDPTAAPAPRVSAQRLITAETADLP